MPNLRDTYSFREPLSDRPLGRREAIDWVEASLAKELGRHFDLSSDEFETLVEFGETPPENQLASDVRNLLAEDKRIRDGGSVDEEYVQRLGYDVCVKPELIEPLITRALWQKKTNQVDVDDLIVAWQGIENVNEEQIETGAAAKKLMDLGVDPRDVADLLLENPRQLRSYARLIEAPVLVSFKYKLFDLFVDTGKTWPLEDVITNAMGLIRMHNKRMEGIEAGDPIAVQARADLLASSKYKEVLGDIGDQTIANHACRTEPGQDAS